MSRDPNSVKMVIAMRTDLGMGPGKMASQAGHAATAWMTELWRVTEITFGKCTHWPFLTDAERKWVYDDFTKIVVGVDSYSALWSLYSEAIEQDVQAFLIVDSGETVFDGVPTLTCVGFGPDYAKNLDPITGELPLL